MICLEIIFCLELRNVFTEDQIVLSIRMSDFSRKDASVHFRTDVSGFLCVYCHYNKADN